MVCAGQGLRLRLGLTFFFFAGQCFIPAIGAPLTACGICLTRCDLEERYAIEDDCSCLKATCCPACAQCQAEREMAIRLQEKSLARGKGRRPARDASSAESADAKSVSGARSNAGSSAASGSAEFSGGGSRAGSSASGSR